jgi:transcriptional/translational regulatory protein YebC/TACO1
MELALEAGAEDFKTDEHGFEIITEPNQFESVHKHIEAKGIKPAVAEVTELPTITVPLQEPAAVASINRLIESLEDHDDVKEVYTNAEFPSDAP